MIINKVKADGKCEVEKLKLTILGPPRTKKTHSRIVIRGKRPKLLPSEQYVEWEQLALPQVFIALKNAKLNTPVFECPVHVTAKFYRDANRGDLNNYQQALADMLQKAGVLKNDSNIESWDGSRKLVDKENPRIEVFIEKLIIW